MRLIIISSKLLSQNTVSLKLCISNSKQALIHICCRHSSPLVSDCVRFLDIIADYCCSRVPDEKPSKSLQPDASLEKGSKKKEEKERKEKEKLEKRKREEAEKQRKRDEEEKKRRDKEERKRIEKERKLFNVGIWTYGLKRMRYLFL